MEEREELYKKQIDRTRTVLSELALRQRQVLEDAYPEVNETIKMALSKGRNRRLWYRRKNIDSDFMALRVGIAKAEPSFSLLKSSRTDGSDPLEVLSTQLGSEFQMLPDLPFWPWQSSLFRSI